jgi:acetylglutamate kinase
MAREVVKYGGVAIVSKRVRRRAATGAKTARAKQNNPNIVH